MYLSVDTIGEALRNDYYKNGCHLRIGSKTVNMTIFFTMRSPVAFGYQGIYHMLNRIPSFFPSEMDVIHENPDKFDFVFNATFRKFIVLLATEMIEDETRENRNVQQKILNN